MGGWAWRQDAPCMLLRGQDSVKAVSLAKAMVGQMAPQQQHTPMCITPVRLTGRRPPCACHTHKHTRPSAAAASDEGGSEDDDDDEEYTSEEEEDSSGSDSDSEGGDSDGDGSVELVSALRMRRALCCRRRCGRGKSALLDPAGRRVWSCPPEPPCEPGVPCLPFQMPPHSRPPPPTPSA